MAIDNTDKSVFVVTFPLKTEKWQEDRIDKMMRLLTVWYNDKQRQLIKTYIHLAHSAEYRSFGKFDYAKKREYLQRNGFPISEYDFSKYFSNALLSKSVSYEDLVCNGLNSKIVQNLSSRACQAWDKKLFGEGKFIRDDNEVTSFKSRRNGDIVVGFVYSLDKFTLTMNATKTRIDGEVVNKKHEIFTIPFIVNRESEYELFALHQEVRNIAIVRKDVRGKHKYYVQFSFAGTPYNKGRKLGKGVVGIDPGPSKIAVVSDKEVKVIPLAESIANDERETRRLQRKLDRSRRATNPDNYNEDGTIKRGIKLRFEKSESYKRTQARLADKQRKLAAKRKIAHNELANELLEMGNEFRVENNSFKSMQRRAKETTKNEKGKNRTKKRFGKSLANRAPSEFLTILENKVKQYAGGVYVDIPTSTACTQYDFTNGEFTKHELRERTISTSDGHEHDRDALAAFNMKFVRTEKVVGKKKLEKSDKNFDNESMAEFYPKFCRMEKKMKK